MVSLNVSYTYSSDERFQAFKLINFPEIKSPFQKCLKLVITLFDFASHISLNFATPVLLD